MPSFSYASTIRSVSENHVLNLKVTHNLVHGSPSKNVRKIRQRPPKELDVVWFSDIVVVLAGSLDGREANPSDIMHSGLLSRVRKQLKANAEQIGLNNISSPYIDGEDGRTKMTLTPSRSISHTLRPHVLLTSLELFFAWKTVRKDTEDWDGHFMAVCDSPFSPTMYLPAETLLGRVTKQFLVQHLVGRYPLIFGPWCKALDLESEYFSPIGRSIIDILEHSQNAAYLSKYHRLMKTARSTLDSVFQASVAAIKTHVLDLAVDGAEGEEDDHPSAASLSDEEVLCQVLEQIYRVGVPQRRLKLATDMGASLRGDDHNLVDSQDSAHFEGATDVPLSWPDADLAEHALDGRGTLEEQLPEGDNHSYMEHMCLQNEGIKAGSINTPHLPELLGSSCFDYLHTLCMDSDLFTRHRSGALGKESEGMPDIESIYPARGRPENAGHLILDDNVDSYHGSSDDIEIMSSPGPFADVAVSNDLDLLLSDPEDVAEPAADDLDADLFVSDSPTTDDGTFRILQEEWGDATETPPLCDEDDVAASFVADLWDL